jgi:hypothetical protein
MKLMDMTFFCYQVHMLFLFEMNFQHISAYQKESNKNVMCTSSSPMCPRSGFYKKK